MKGYRHYRGVLFMELAMVLALFGVPHISHATNTRDTIAFQARILTKDRLNAPSGSFPFRFSLYSGVSGGNALWTEQWTNDNQVEVRHGVFTAILGSITPLSSSLFANASTYLTVEFDSDNNGSFDQLFTARIPVTAVPYALSANSINGTTVDQLAANTSPYITLSNSSDLSNERALTGTADQVLLNDGGANSSLTLSLPQSIAQTSVVQFGSLGLGADAGTAKLTFATATTPAGGIIFGGDTNLYRSAADTIKTDDKLVASKLAIGTDSYLSQEIFRVVAPGSGDASIFEREGGNVLALYNPATATVGNESRLIFSLNNSSEGARTYGLIGAGMETASGYAKGYLSFRTADNGSYGTEHMRLTSTGNLGIGTTTPAAKLGFAAATTAAGGIDFGTDTNLYRSASDILKTDDSLAVGTNVSVAGAVMSDYNGALNVNGHIVSVGSANQYQTVKIINNSGTGRSWWLSSNNDGTFGIVDKGVNDAGTATTLATLNSSGMLYLVQAGSSAGLMISDTNLYRSAANTLKTDGSLVVGGTSADLLAQGDLRYYDSDSSNYVGFQAPATVASNVIWTLPAVDGSAGQCLSTNSGTLSWANCTASSGAPTTSQYVTLALDGSLSAERVLTGTANQVVLTDGGANGNITLSTPQDIATSSAVQFGSLGLGQAANTYKLSVPAATTATGGIDFGGDVDLYRSAANRLKTDDILIVDTGASIADITNFDPSTVMVMASTEHTTISTYSTRNTDGNPVGGMRLYGNNDAVSPAVIQYGIVSGSIVDSAAGAETGKVSIYTRNNAAGAGSYGRVDIDENGKIWLGAASGSGTGTNDVNLYRSAANTLKTDDSLNVTGGIISGDTVKINDGTSVTTLTTGPATTDTAKLYVYRNLTGNAPNIYLGGSTSGGGASATPTVYFGDAGNAYAGIRGTLEWPAVGGRIGFFTSPDLTSTAVTESLRIKSDGNTSLGTNQLLFGTFGSEDTNLYRSAANTLKTDDSLVVGGTSADLLTQGDLRFYDGDSSNYVGFQAPAAVGSNLVWTLPAVDGGAGQCLSTNAGTLSWSDCSGGSGAPTTSQYVTLALDGTLSGERVLTGTSNQITITDNGANGTVVLATPQNIDTGASPTFASLNLSATSNQIVMQSAGITGTLTWTPTNAGKTIILPDAAGTVAVSAATPLALSATGALTIQDAVADGATKGAASFTAADFDSSSGNISIDYTNGQAASAGTKGFLTSADWTTFNGKLATGSTLFTLAGTSGDNQTISQGNTLTIAAGTDISTTGGATDTVTIADTATLATITSRGATTTTLVNLDGGIAVDTSNFTVSGTSGATAIAAVNGAGASASALTLSGTIGIFDGSDTFRGLYLNYTNANHTGVSNVFNGVDIANITGDADAIETAINVGTGWDYGLTAPAGGTAAMYLSDTGGTAVGGIQFGTDVTLYRSTANTLKTDDSLVIAGASTDLLAQADLRYYDSDSSNYVGFQSPATVGSNLVWTLPAVDGGSGQCLSTTAGVLSWSDCSGGSGAPTTSQYVTLALDGTLSAERVLTGTANQVVLTDGGANGNITLSLPQSVATSSAVQFGSLGLGTAAGSSKLTFVAATTATGGIDFGGDANLYRGAANELATDDLISFGSTKTATTTDFKTYKTIDAAASVGFIFDTSATVTTGSLMSVRNNGIAKFGIDNDGKVVMASTLTQSGTPVDLAENIQVSDATIGPGDVVAADPNTPGSTIKATADNQVLGVISTEPGILMGGGNPGVPIVLAGRIPVKVTDANGMIHAGDIVIPSATPGRGQRGGDITARMIGVALSNQQTAEDTITVQLQIGYYSPTLGANPSSSALSPQQQAVLGAISLLSDNVLSVDALQVRTLTVIEALHVNGTTVFATAPVFPANTAGVVTVPAGQQSIDVTFVPAHQQTPVITVSVTSGTAATAAELAAAAYAPIVVNPSSHGFTIMLAKPAASDVPVSWIALTSQ